MMNPTNTTQNFNETALSAEMERSILKEKMRRAAEKCGSALLRYYIQTGDGSHENKMKYVLKDLLYSQTEEPEYLCETIYEEANTHLAEAIKYGFTPKDLSELRSNIDQYRVLVRSKRQPVPNKRKLEDVMMDWQPGGKRTV